MKQELYESLKTLCQKRKSVRSFLSRPVEAEKIQQIKEIARTSPFASGRKNWDILTVQDPALIQQMVDVIKTKTDCLTSEILEDFKDSFSHYARNFVIFQSSSTLLIPTYRVSHTLSLMLEQQNNLEITAWEKDNFLQSIACVSMLILLAAESLNLGACYMTGPLIAEKELNALLKIKPEHRIGAIIPIGYY